MRVVELSAAKIRGGIGMPVSVVLLAAALFTAGCSKEETDGINTIAVMLPNQSRITAQVMRSSLDLMRGMMFRDSLAADHGMLFVHPKEGAYKYWMFHTRIPLDMIWMDRDRHVVEVVANAQPCTAESASTCPTYGGHQTALYVLELNGGAAAKNNVKVGDTIEF